LWIGNNIALEGARMLSCGLKINTGITKLDLSCHEKKELLFNSWKTMQILSGNNLGLEGARMISHAFKSTRRSAELNLGGNEE